MSSLSKFQSEMGDYISLQQQKSGWSGTLEPVLKCCIKARPMKGFCNVCMQNFKYRNGPYYPGFVEADDDNLLDRMESGLKPFGSFTKLECDEELKMKIAQRGLFLVRVFQNPWNVWVHNVMKNPNLKLSDLADLPRLGEILRFEVKDRRLVELEYDTSLTLIETRLKYGYPFYTLPREAYINGVSS